MVDDKAVGVSDPGRKSCLCGVVSLAGGVIVVVSYGLIIGIAIAVAILKQGDESVETPRIASHLFRVGIVANIVGLIFGISGWIKSNQKKLLSIIGLVINVIVFILMGMLVLASFIFA